MTPKQLEALVKALETDYLKPLMKRMHELVAKLEVEHWSTGRILVKRHSVTFYRLRDDTYYQSGAAHKTDYDTGHTYLALDLTFDPEKFVDGWIEKTDFYATGVDAHGRMKIKLTIDVKTEEGFELYDVTYVETT